jgi:hypothetical protein
VRAAFDLLLGEQAFTSPASRCNILPARHAMGIEMKWRAFGHKPTNWIIC